MPTLRLLLCLALLGLGGCEPVAQDIPPGTSQAIRFRAARQVPPRADPDRLRIMSYNIKYAGGRLPFWFDCWGDRARMEPAEVQAHLAGLIDLIREADPDVLLVQEIELNSRRSAYIDQVQAILEGTDLNQAAYFRTWDSRYIPTEGLGRMDLGMAIFSKYPIVEAGRIRQQDRTDLDAATAVFYIQRAIGRAVIAVGEAQLATYVVHTEAYDVDGTKQAQIAQIAEVIRAEPLPWILGGDFNELPPTAVIREGFLDERSTDVCGDDFRQPPYTPEVMAPFFEDFSPWLPLAQLGDTAEAQLRYATHSVLGPDERNEAGAQGDWNRTLDYLFAVPGSAWVRGASDVLQRAGQGVGTTGWVLQADPLRLSDHAPVFGIWRLP